LDVFFWANTLALPILLEFENLVTSTLPVLRANDSFDLLWIFEIETLRIIQILWLFFFVFNNFIGIDEEGSCLFIPFASVFAWILLNQSI
jgi:hypothetical protein